MQERRKPRSWLPQPLLPFGHLLAENACDAGKNRGLCRSYIAIAFAFASQGQIVRSQREYDQLTIRPPS